MERRGQQQDVAIACQPVDFDDVKHFCSWIHEANDKNFTKTAATHFPSYIRFSRYLGSNSDTRGLILPSDIDNLFYIIRASPHVFTLEVELFCKFAGNALSRFWKAVAESKTKIEELNLSLNEKIDDEGFVFLARLPGIRRLRLLSCDISSKGCVKFVEEIIRTNHKIEELDLSQNEKIGDEGFVILAHLPGIRRLELFGCDISSKGCVEFAEEIIKRNHKIEELDLGGNDKIDNEGFVILARLPGIRRLELWECDISSKGCVKFVEEIIRTNHKIEELDLGGNDKIDNEGFVILARLPGIRRLDLGECDISSKGCAKFAEEIIRTNHKIEELDLGGNENIDDEGFVILARLPGIRRLDLGECDISSKGCAKFAEEIIRTNHKIEELDLGGNDKIDNEGFVILARLPGIRRLELWECDISSKGCAKFAEEIIRTNHKLEHLGLSGIRRIGDDGARSLFCCFHLIEKLDLCGCDVTEAVEEEIRSELRRLNLPEDRVLFDL